MRHQKNNAERVVLFRNVIQAFIDKRREDKLKGGDDPDTIAKYEYDTWLESAARRVTQIQAVTHVLKGSHPDARGTSLYVSPNELTARADVGSHMLHGVLKEDVVGNAAALDVYKLLKEEVDGQPLLHWAQAGDANLEAALASNPAVARDRLQAFAGLVRADNALVSHPLAKQVYWLVGEDPTDDGQFHLLQPMFPSSLVQAVHDNIQAMRFGEANTVARKAFRNRELHGDTYHDYRGLAVRKLGGTKPQNVSQLNSERGGNNYLLASLPPSAWRERHQFKLLNAETALDNFRWFHDGEASVNERVRELAAFLKANPDRTMEARDTRKTMEQELGLQLQLFANAVRYQNKPGWTRDASCHLAPCEQLWLDPERVELAERADTPEHAEADAAFKRDFASGDWMDEIAGRFAAWLNGRLRKAGLNAMGDVEFRHWARQAIVQADWPVPLQRQASASMGDVV